MNTNYPVDAKLETESEFQLQLIHAIPGRVHFRVTGDPPQPVLERLIQQLHHQPGIEKVEPRSTAHNWVVYFNPEATEKPSVLDQLHSIQPSKALHANASNDIPSLTSVLDRLPQTVLPILAGYGVTRTLGITGLFSIPVFMLTDAVTTRVLNFLIETQQQPESQTEDSDSEHFQDTAETIPTSQPIAYTVAHQLPGRIRLKVPRLKQDQEYTNKLTALLKADARITEVRVTASTGSLSISYDASESSEMNAHLIDLIQTAPALEWPPESTGEAVDKPADSETVNPWENLKLPVAVLGLTILTGPMGVPIPAGLVAASVALATLPVAQRAIESIVTEQRLNIDFLDLAAITITTLQGNFLNPALMIGLIEFGEAIREQSARSSKRQALDLLSSLQKQVWVERNGEELQIDIQDVQHDEIVVVYPGDQVPVDGHIVKGRALIDEQKLTGESMPVLRKKGQTVYASTLVREGQIHIRAERLNTETRAGLIMQVIQDAPVHDTRIGNYAATIADRMVLPTLFLSAAVFAVTRNPARAASVLTLDFATGIRVSVPTTVLAALSYAARRGILIRSGRTLEQLAKVDAVVFDKTGTLTQGEAVVVSVETVNDATCAREMLTLAAAAEQRLTHPVAEAIVRYAQAQGVIIPNRGKWDYRIGQGVRAEIDGRVILVGSRHFLEDAGIDLATLHEQYRTLLSSEHSVIYVACDGALHGAIAYRDPLRPESREVVLSLRQSDGMEVHLLTGDNHRVAAAVALELGIAETHTYAEAFPEQKVAVVKGLHAEGKTVAFVGDGINDSPALAYADVSVSFAGGSEVARETADVVLMENSLQGLPEAIAIARQAMQLIHQNTALVAVPNLSAMLLAVTIGIPPLSATIVNNGSTIVAGLNGLRPLLTKDKDLKLLATTLETQRSTEQVPEQILEQVSESQPSSHLQ